MPLANDSTDKPDNHSSQDVANSGAKLASELKEATPETKSIDLREVDERFAILIINTAITTLQRQGSKSSDKPIEFIIDIGGKKVTIKEIEYPLLGQLHQAVLSAPAIISADKALAPLDKEAKEYRQVHRTKKLYPELREKLHSTKLKLLQAEANLKQLLAENHNIINTRTLTNLLSEAASQKSNLAERNEIFKSFIEIMQGIRGEIAISSLLAELDPADVSFRPGSPEEDLKRADILIQAKYRGKVVHMSFDVKCKKHENGERFAPERLDTRDVGEEEFDGVRYHQLEIFLSDDAIDEYCQIKPEYKHILLGRMDEIIGLRDLHTSMWRPRS